MKRARDENAAPPAMPGQPRGPANARYGVAPPPPQAPPPAPSIHAEHNANRPNGPLSHVDALSYLREVKETFKKQRHVYEAFLDIMKKFKAEHLSTQGVINRVKVLFRGHRNLILGFNTFLPKPYAIELPPEDVRTGAGAGQKQPVEFDHAISYVNKIKQRFADNEKVYKQFLEILNLYRKAQKSIQHVYAEVAKLFKDHADLLAEFENFLPDSSTQQGAKRPPGAKGAAGRKGPPGPPAQIGSAQKRKQQRGGSRAVEEEPPTKGKPGAQAPGANLARELGFFERVKNRLRNKDAYQDFLKCLHLFNNDIISKRELDRLVVDILGNKHADLMSGFTELVMRCETMELDVNELERHASEPKGPLFDGGLYGSGVSGSMRGVSSKEAAKMRAIARQEAFLSRPISELDLSSCERCTTSYRLLPKTYPQAICHKRTDLEYSVLNDKWVSVTTGSEDYSFKHMRKNQYEEALFRCEDDRFELEMILHSNKMAIDVFSKIHENIKAANLATPEARQAYAIPQDFLPISPVCYRCVDKIYGDHGSEVVSLLKRFPGAAVGVVLERLKQKQEEWTKVQREMNRVWRDVYEKNYHKSLDHRSFYFKQQDQKALKPKWMVTELKEAAEKAKPVVYNGNGTMYINNALVKPSGGEGEDAAADGTVLMSEDQCIVSLFSAVPTVAAASASAQIARSGCKEAHPNAVFTPKVPSEMELRCNEQRVHDDVYNIIRYAARETLSAEGTRKVLRMWKTFVEPFYGLPPRPEDDEVEEPEEEAEEEDEEGGAGAEEGEAAKPDEPAAAAQQPEEEAEPKKGSKKAVASAKKGAGANVKKEEDDGGATAADEEAGGVASQRTRRGGDKRPTRRGSGSSGGDEAMDVDGAAPAEPAKKEADAASKEKDAVAPAKAKKKPVAKRGSGGGRWGNSRGGRGGRGRNSRASAAAAAEEDDQEEEQDAAEAEDRAADDDDEEEVPGDKDDDDDDDDDDDEGDAPKARRGGKGSGKRGGAKNRKGAGKSAKRTDDEDDDDDEEEEEGGAMVVDDEAAGATADGDKLHRGCRPLAPKLDTWPARFGGAHMVRVSPTGAAADGTSASPADAIECAARILDSPNSDDDTALVAEGCPRRLVFYGHDAYYILFRLHRHLYERMQSARESSVAMGALRAAKDDVAVGGAAAGGAAGAAPGDGDSAAAGAEAAAVHREFITLLENTLDNRIDASTYEDECRMLMGTSSYVLFTLDKLIIKVVKQVSGLLGDESAVKLHQLFQYECSRNLGPDAVPGDVGRAGIWNEQTYAINAYSAVGCNEEQFYRFESVLDESRPSGSGYPACKLAISLVDVASAERECAAFYGSAGHSTMDAEFAAYLREYVDGDVEDQLVAVGGDGSRVLLRRCVLRVAAAATSVPEKRGGRRKGGGGSAPAPGGVAAVPPPPRPWNGLECKLSTTSSKVSYVLGTEDVFYRPPGVHGRPAVAKRAKGRSQWKAKVQHFRRWVEDHAKNGGANDMDADAD